MKYAAKSLLLTLGLGVAGCATQIDETYYLATPVGDDVNFYRFKVKGRARLSKVEYRRGWYPRSAVDSLFGAVSKESESEYRKTQKEAQTKIDTAVTETLDAYLEQAKKPEVDAAELGPYLEAHRRVRELPAETDPSAGTVLMEYDPLAGLRRVHADEKMVIVMSSNPDEIIGAIVEVAEDQKTQDFIGDLSGVLRRDRENRQAKQDQEDLAAVKYDDEPLIKALDAALNKLDTADRAQLLGVLEQVESSL